MFPRPSIAKGITCKKIQISNHFVLMGSCPLKLNFVSYNCSFNMPSLFVTFQTICSRCKNFVCDIIKFYSHLYQVKYHVWHCLIYWETKCKFMCYFYLIIGRMSALELSVDFDFTSCLNYAVLLS